MDNRTNRARQQTLWQRFPNSAKVCIAVAIVLIILALLSSYAIKLWFDPMAASQITIWIMVVLNVGVIVSMVIFGILTFAQADKTYVEANTLFSKAEQTLKETQSVLTVTRQVSIKSKEVLNSARQSVEGFIFGDGFDDEFDDEVEITPDGLTPLERQATLLNLPEGISYEEYMQILQEWQEEKKQKQNQGEQPDDEFTTKEVQNIVAEVMQHTSGQAGTLRGTNNIVATIDRIQTGEINVEFVKSAIGHVHGTTEKKVNEPLPPKAAQQSDYTKQPDSPESQPEEQPEPQPQSIEEQVAELGLPDTTISLLAYLLKTGGYNHYSELPPKQRKQLDACKRLSSAG